MRNEIGSDLTSGRPVLQGPLRVKTTLTPTDDTHVLIRDTVPVSWPFRDE